MTAVSDAESFPWNTQRSVGNTPRRNPLDGYNRQPKNYLVNGVDVPYYGLGAVAHVLGRETATLRGWETLGFLPKPPAIYRSKDPKDPVTKKHGQRRLYPEELVIGIYEIARQEGILDKRQPIKDTNFPQRVRTLFRAYKEEQEELRRSYNRVEPDSEHQKDRA